ncbi:hypothetical protein HHI36_016975 [Cryptolaemus montrouzieri]|uniref:Uncharacterized protein n=1 Tax=Cryptolaemus montrouzieri TaxID=559131 RepID=A0ABD2NLQ6_9CUCU
MKCESCQALWAKYTHFNCETCKVTYCWKCSELIELSKDAFLYKKEDNKLLKAKLEEFSQRKNDQTIEMEKEFNLLRKSEKELQAKCKSLQELAQNENREKKKQENLVMEADRFREMYE